MSTLSERVRPGQEAAPWVCDEIRKLECQLRLLNAAHASTIEQAALRPLADRLSNLIDTLRGKSAAEAREVWRELFALAYGPKKPSGCGRSDA